MKTLARNLVVRLWLASTVMATAGPSPAPVPVVALTTPAPEAAPLPEGMLRLNFRGVPIEMVLDYLSEAAGFVIVKETELKGSVDVRSSQPVSRDEAVELLNTILNRQGYAALRNGRTLTIVARDAAKQRDLPVKHGGLASAMPKSDTLVTQIIPVRAANVTQLTTNLKPLIGTYAELTVNESANSLILTATQTDIRRLTEIINALDDSIADTSTLRVFPLNHADAKELATVLKELFAPATQSSRGNNNNTTRPSFGGNEDGAPGENRGPGGPGGDGNAGGETTRRAGGSAANGRVLAVADERSNSLIVVAPADLMTTVTRVVTQTDQPVGDATELRVFHLVNSDPSEMAATLASVFPDDSKSGATGDQVPVLVGGGPGAGNQTAATGSTRALKQSRVLAVPDARTGSLVVTTSSQLMTSVAGLIKQLDQNPARKQKVFVYTLANADTWQVEQVLQSTFPQSGGATTRTTTTQNNALAARMQANNQNMQSSSSSSGFGNFGGSGTGSTGGGQTQR